MKYWPYTLVRQLGLIAGRTHLSLRPLLRRFASIKTNLDAWNAGSEN
jgi:hypothetical protein